LARKTKIECNSNSRSNNACAIALETGTAMVHFWCDQWSLSVSGILWEWGMHLQPAAAEDNVSGQLPLRDSQPENCST